MKGGNNKIKVSFLPVAGQENPYQYITMQQLNETDTISVREGIKDKFFGIIRTAVFQKPDIVHFDWIEYFYFRRWVWLTYLSIPIFFLQIWFIKRIFRIKIIFTLHNISPHDTRNKKLHGHVHKQFIQYVNIIRVFYHASVNNVVNNFQIAEKKIIVAPHPHYIDYYPNTISRLDARKFLNISENKKVFLFFGNLRKYKGIDELLYLFNKQNDNNVVLVIAGKLYDTTYLKIRDYQNNSNIIIHNRYIKTEEVQYYFNACDVVILPFKKIESSGTVILAMSFSKPVITSSEFAVTEILKKQKELLYLDQMSEAIKKVSNISTNVLFNIGKANREEVIKIQNTVFLNTLQSLIIK
ncbi:MAG: glycosyltransferase family 4 protein [Fimbriimonadaceae bacterium]|nr:glycosyltransferase family 4 protein [Chitinophagales bacterium]